MGMLKRTLSIVGAETINEIDRQMKASYKKLEITGLKQEGFDYLIEKYGERFNQISFFKCPLVGDLSKLEMLRGIKSLSFYWNQRANRLWDLSKNLELKSIRIEDFTRLHRLDDLINSDSLEEIRFGDKIWDSLVLETLNPISNVKNLKKLSFSAKKIEDFRISPLAEIDHIKELEFPSNLFTTEKVAWLTARIGDRVKSIVLAPFLTTFPPIAYNGKKIDTYIVGKRKPSLDSTKDADRIKKYVDKFNSLTKYYRENPEEPEPE